MADILERKIPYLFPGDLELRLDAQNFVTAISGYPVGGGGGTVVESDFIWKPVINQDGTIGWARDTSATTPATANLVPHIYNNYWYIGTSNTNVEARGPQGPAGADGTNGTDGKDGEDGISPTVTTATIEGGNRVIFTYDNGGTPATESIDVMSGASGAKGSDGFSPVVTITDAPTAAQHPQGGKTVTITDAAHPDGQSFDIWNGINGEGATVNLLDGNGIHITNDGTNYTISVSADYATKSYVDSASAYALSEAKDWVENKHYLTSVPDTYALKSDIPTKITDLTDSADYAKKTDLEEFVTSSDVTTQDTDYVMTTTGWKVLSLPGGGMTQVIHDTTLTGQGNADDSKLGVAWSALSGNTIASANSAYWAVKAKTNDGQHEYTIGTELASLNSIIQYLDGWAETAITGDQGVEVLDLDEDGYPETFQLTQTAYNAVTSVSSKVAKPTSLVDKYLVLRTDSNGDVSGWCDFQDQSYSKTEALGTFVATANIDTTTLSGDGKSVSTKLGVKTDVIATKNYVNSSFLPTSGGTVSGQLVVSGDGNFDQENLKFIRSGLNGYGRIGLASNGALAVKVDDSNSNTTQINVAANASYNELIQVQHGGTTAYLIPAVTSTTTAGLTNDGILHIILES